MKKINPNRKVTMTVKEIRQLKAQSTNEAVEIIRLIPLYVLRDTFGFGQKRLVRFVENFENTIDAYNDDDITLDDIRQMLSDEVKIDIMDGR